jgi:hypothetical protein
MAGIPTSKNPATTTPGKTTTSKNPTPVGNKWDLSNWTEGKVSLFQALGITKGTIQFPQLTATLPGASAQAASDQSASATGAGNTSASSTGSGTSGSACTTSQITSNKTLGQQLATAAGWGSGTQWTALNNVVMAESGWCNTAQNPTSTAYGIGQFLNTTWAGTGYSKSSSAQTQILAMLAYIKMRYGTPSAAWAFEQANGYY